MLRYPDMDPVAFSIAGVNMHWYGLMYLLGFVIFMLLGRGAGRLGNFINGELWGR